MSGDVLARISLVHDEDVVTARRSAHDVAALLGFDRQDQTRIATATSELARNAHRYAKGGEVILRRSDNTLAIEVTDEGGGIDDLDAVLSGSYVSSTGMGRGLAGVQRLMDAFDVASSPEAGTRVTASKCLPPRGWMADARTIRDALRDRGGSDPYEEVTRQNQELLQALQEVRARQQELMQLNQELDDTNRGVVALYAELDDRAEQLRDADDRKSRFLADMSHELRTPVNSIVALTELLLDGDPPLRPEQHTQVSFIRRTAADQLRLIGDLLDIAKIEAGHVDIELADVSVSELFALLRAQLRPLVSVDVQLRFEADPTLSTLRTDELKLVQVLRNLIANALRFTQAGSVTVRAEAANNGARFTVQDTGVGIAPADLDRVFAEFVQLPGELQKPGMGTGLGLPLARKLVGLLGGSIEVSSEVDEGTTFVVDLSDERADDAAAGPDPSGGILIVDDDETARYVLRAHLQGNQRLFDVATGRDALQACARGVPDAIFLDLSLPDIDGVEVLEALREMDGLEQTPVIIHSSRLLEAEAVTRITGLGARVLSKSEASRDTVLEALAAATVGRS